MKIVFVTGNYPSPARPENGSFVQEFVWAMARAGNSCYVIRPTRFSERRYGHLPPRMAVEDAGRGCTVRVQRPRYLSFSSRNLGVTHTGRWTQGVFSRAVLDALRLLQQRPDILYGHFLYESGFAAVRAGISFGVPAVVGVGEGTFWTVKAFGRARARSHFNGASGFLAVGSHIRDALVSSLHLDAAKIHVEPNGVDRSKFRPYPRAEVRERLGLDGDLFIVTFAGTWNDLKGGPELVEAVRGLDGIGLVILGRGPKVLSSEKTVFQGLVPHRDMPLWLSASDVFVLPTRVEGSCNAVIEAMACGLPIVTSDGQHMDDIVDERVAIRVNAADVVAIREAILLLKNDPARRDHMGQAALRRAAELDIDRRAQRVAKWMSEVAEVCLVREREAER